MSYEGTTTAALIFIAVQLYFLSRLLQRRAEPSDANQIMARDHYLVERLELRDEGRDRLETGTERVPWFNIQEPYRWHNPKWREWVGDTLYFNAGKGREVLAERKFVVFRDYGPAKQLYDASVRAAPYNEIATEVWLKVVHMPSNVIASERMPGLAIEGYPPEHSGTIVHVSISPLPENAD